MFSINEALQMKSLTFVIDACKILAQARKVGILMAFMLLVFFNIFRCCLDPYGCICEIGHVGAGVLVCIQLL